MPATDWKESVAPDEDRRFIGYAEELRALQRKRAGQNGADRALHAKGQAGVAAEFTVLPDLPAHARVALFATPGTHRAYVRFSNGSGARQKDPAPDVRGVAIKVLGVDGKKIIPGLENARTQDFLLIQSPATPFRDADEFVWFVKAAASPALLPLKVIGRHGLGGLGLLKRLLGGISRPVPSLATSRYWSALPIRLGPYAVHYALVPATAPDGQAKPGRTPDYLRDELAARLEKGPVAYDFCLQFYEDEARTPIEDASREWKESDAPLVKVARLTLLQQSMNSAGGQRLSQFIEKLSFDPWHALEELRPLGNMMRARNHAYRLSTQERAAAPEPDGSETFD